jgi:hypothetical protein
MPAETRTPSGLDGGTDRGTVELPRPTAWPIVLSLGLALAATGVVAGTAFMLVGGAVFVAGLVGWIAELRPGEGHVREQLVEPADRQGPVREPPRAVEQLRPGRPGYRLRLPERVHPVSAGLKGGIVGGLVMPVPALLWSFFSGHGVWYPMNLLAGMALPNVGDMSVQQLEQFQPSLFMLAVTIHVVLSSVFGLIYGVVLPTLPEVPRPITWGALLMPIAWTGVTYLVMAAVSPEMVERIRWFWFIVSQLVYGITMAAVVLRARGKTPVLSGVVGGLVGGVVMVVPAMLWAVATHHGIWHPVNVLAGIVINQGDVDINDLGRFHSDWFFAAAGVHGVLCISFGVLFGLLNRRLPPIPGSLPWGGIILPLIWTGTCYGLMGVVNPLLQDRAHWPWFVASQFIFGVTAAAVVHRSETVRVPPAGHGPDRASDFVAGAGGGPP